MHAGENNFRRDFLPQDFSIQEGDGSSPAGKMAIPGTKTKSAQWSGFSMASFRRQGSLLGPKSGRSPRQKTPKSGNPHGSFLILSKEPASRCQPIEPDFGDFKCQVR